MKVCYRCKKTLPIDQFCKDKRRPHGVGYGCKSCENERNRKRYRSEYFAEYHLRTTYGLTELDKQRFIEANNGKCACCHTVPKKFVVDHNHLTGKIRGIICQKCNTMIGFIEQNPDLYELCKKYLLALS